MEATLLNIHAMYFKKFQVFVFLNKPYIFVVIGSATCTPKHVKREMRF